jgi:hypothetical protein
LANKDDKAYSKDIKNLDKVKQPQGLSEIPTLEGSVRISMHPNSFKFCKNFEPFANGY